MRSVPRAPVAMISRSPPPALNPVLTVGRQIEEVLERHTALTGAALRRARARALDAVGILGRGTPPREYPFQLSGGLKQRVMIAAAPPPTRGAHRRRADHGAGRHHPAQILDLLVKLQSEPRWRSLLITHDLGIVARMAQRVAVM